MDNTHERHDDTPGENDGGEEDTGRPFLDSDVGKWLESGVGDEEDGKGNVVITTSHLKSRFHVCNTCVSNVGTVQEGKEIQEREPRDQPLVHLPDECFVLDGFSTSQNSREERERRTSLARSSSLLPASGSGYSSISLGELIWELLTSLAYMAWPFSLASRLDFCCTAAMVFGASGWTGVQESEETHSRGAAKCLYMYSGSRTP